MGDLLINMCRKGTISWAPSKLLMVAVALALTGGIAWEIYEYVGDKLLDTGRHNGAEDTIYDLISDTVGAVTAASFLYWWHFMSSNEPASDRRQPAVVTTDDEMQRLDLHQR
ncbi:MAG: hypothetical protein KC438_07485, partial [Thermomicrobiales bacterium]|nr:hypothetical protein [Thermomicrobiales bacterium]